jgi:hypothetical protein
VDRGGVGLGEDRAHERGDERAGRLRHLREQVADEVRPASLPRGPRERRGDRVDQAGVRIGDDQPDAREPSCDQAAEERRPAGAVLGGVQVKTQDLPHSLHVHAGRDHAGDVADPAVLTHLLGERVEPDVGVGTAVKRPGAEGFDLVIEFLGHPLDRLLEIRSIPSVRTSPSIRPVDTPRT